MNDFPWGDLTPAQRRQIHEAHADAKTRRAKTAAPANAVKPGQVWADNDPRSAGRTLRVEQIDGDKAVCVILTNTDETQRDIDNPPSRTWGLSRDRRGSRTRISLARFVPNRTGYRLLEDATEES